MYGSGTVVLSCHCLPLPRYSCGNSAWSPGLVLVLSSSSSSSSSSSASASASLVVLVHVVYLVVRGTALTCTVVCSQGGV